MNARSESRIPVMPRQNVGSVTSSSKQFGGVSPNFIEHVFEQSRVDVGQLNARQHS
jgi:hypothetical protein